MRKVRHILVLSLVSLIHAGVAHTQGIQTNGLYGGTIACFAMSDASLLTATGGSEDRLINNKEYRSKVESAFREREQLAHNRKDKLFSVLESGLSLQQEEALKFLFAYMPLSDLADYDGDLFLANANIALRTRQESPWGKSIPEDIFLHYVLPCRVSNENLDSFRMAYYEEIHDRVKGMEAAEAALEINHWCHEKVTYQPIGGRYTGPMGIVLSAQGSCGMESIFTVASLRTAGIPARMASTIWAHRRDDDHAWVEVWIDGKWHYMGACEPQPVLDWAWFTESARRAMLISTKSFGAKYEHENTMVDYRNYSLVNTLARYAATKTITVKVIDTNNVPVKDALVEYMIFQWGLFYPIAEVPTDELGISRFETGLGDLLIWARRGNDFNFRKICVSDTDRLDLTLNRKPADHGSEELDIGVPVERESLKGPAAELIAANTKRTNEEDKIRQAYIDLWMKPEDAAQLAKELGADPNTVKDIISRSMGNYKNIASFLTHTPVLNRPLAINLLKQLRNKDLRDITEDVLADHLNNVIRFEKTRGAYTYELYLQYVLNPRISSEMILAWRKYLLQSVPVRFRQKATNDPSILIKYVKNNIVLDDDETRESYVAPPISPKGVDELKVADTFSRDIYFVALCRSLGIPSRIERRDDDSRPQFYFNKEWHDVWFKERNQPLPGKGFIRFSSGEKDPIPEHFTHFTIAHFENGHYKTLFIKVDLQDELALTPGHYMLVTGNRINDSKVLAILSFFELKQNEHKAIDIKLRRWSQNTTGVGFYYAALSGDLANVKRLIQEGSDVDRKDEWGWTALYWAMRGNQKEVAEFLIAEGANVNAKGEKDRILLHIAAEANQKELAEMLITKGADVNAKEDEYGATPLNCAIWKDNIDMVKLLLANGADVNATGNFGWTPLHDSAWHGRLAIAELLIAKGAKVNAQAEKWARTPLDAAISQGHTKVAQLLRKNGAKE